MCSSRAPPSAPRSSRYIVPSDPHSLSCAQFPFAQGIGITYLINAGAAVYSRGIAEKKEQPVTFWFIKVRMASVGERFVLGCGRGRRRRARTRAISPWLLAHTRAQLLLASAGVTLTLYHTHTAPPPHGLPCSRSRPTAARRFLQVFFLGGLALNELVEAVPDPAVLRRAEWRASQKKK